MQITRIKARSFMRQVFSPHVGAFIFIVVLFVMPAFAQERPVNDWTQTLGSWFGQALDGAPEAFNEAFQEVPGLSAAEAMIYRQRLAEIRDIVVLAGAPDYCRDLMLDQMADQCLTAIDAYLVEIQSELASLRSDIQSELKP